jgi:S-adenosylmethionine:tRNA ribosyltransferase-isomerase
VLSGLSLPRPAWHDGTTNCDSKLLKFHVKGKSVTFAGVWYLLHEGGTSRPATSRPADQQTSRQMIDIDINEYDYDLPEGRIAQFPLKERDRSKLLLFDGRDISSAIFSDIDRYLPPGSLLVFNNTRVIRARLLFTKTSGANIEVFCLEPLCPADYESSFASKEGVEWKCMVGNLKKWKTGGIYLGFEVRNKKNRLCAEKICPEGDAWRIRLSWDNPDLSFSEVIEATGHIPLPPYITREDEPDDTVRYQTIYSTVKGSVAAPTAGLHFTENIMSKLNLKKIRLAELTLHVGAGTFQPVRNEKISGHEMHAEHFFITQDTLRTIIENTGKIIGVGTTSVRTLESLYWLGVKAFHNRLNNFDELVVDQWEPYVSRSRKQVSVMQSLEAIYELMKRKNRTVLAATTKLIIVPGYEFRIIDGMITNFHQPRSTLLLLVSAWVGPKWKEIYRYALESNFRFLSYGDASLLTRQKEL